MYVRALGSAHSLEANTHTTHTTHSTTHYYQPTPPTPPQVQRQLFKITRYFVEGNINNQNAIFITFLDPARRLLGPLRDPPPPAKKKPGLGASSSSTASSSEKVMPPPASSGLGLNVEEVLVECLRGNQYLCTEKVPRDLIAEFGELWNDEPDPSTSGLIDFFEICCMPEGETFHTC
jgi:hypothetical protein